MHSSYLKKFIFFALLNLKFSYNLPQPEHFDYIVVGGGTAGGTLAVELSKKFKVLLIEAGPLSANNLNITIPGFHPRAVEDEKIGFKFKVKHYENDNNLKVYPRGSGLGGSSLMNAMVAVYPNKKDFDLMFKVTNKDSSWLEENMYKYFIQLQKNFYKIKYQKIEKNSFSTSPLYEIFDKVLPNFDSYELNNKNPTNGMLNTDSEGFYFIPAAIDFIERAHFVEYILKPSQSGNSNLTIWTDTLVTKILFSTKENLKAAGVYYTKGKHLYEANPLSKIEQNKNDLLFVKARKEVILSAGVFNTPQLLMLSGIGNKKILDKFNIKVVKELKNVGKNLQDRYEIPVSIKFPKDYVFVNCSLSTDPNKDECFKMYIKNSTGLYATNGIVSGQLIKSSNKLSESDLFILNLFGIFKGYQKGWVEEYYNNFDTFTQLIIKARSNNKQGFVELKSNSPFEQPEINFNYFNNKNLNDEDLKILVDQVKKQKLFLKDMDFDHEEFIPGDEINTDEKIRDYIVNNSWGHHACCTSKMGMNETEDVVDNKFKVYGVRGLRIVDASIFPDIPGYFPCAYVHMIAMKAADAIMNEVE